MRIVLFDIDGTLLRCGREVGRCFLAALEEVYGVRPELEGYSFAGKTDPGIVYDLVGGAAGDHSAVAARLPAFRTLYLERLRRELDPAAVRLLPGVRALLQGLRQVAPQEQVLVGLLTGNFEEGAYLKLRALDLEGFFALGGFGEDGAERSLLLEAATARAMRHCGRTIERGSVLIVGDSVHDVDCARAGGAALLAVASGTTSREQLRAAGARTVHDSLEELDAAQLLASCERAGVEA